MTQNQKYRINSLAKDLGLKSKDLVELLAAKGYPGRTHMAVLEPEEFNVIIDHLTSASTIEDINAYMDGKIQLEKPKAEPKPEVKAEVKADAKPEVKAEVKADAKPEAKAEVKADAKPEVKAEVKADAKPEAKAEVKADAKPETKAEVKADAKPEVKAEVKADAKPEVKADVKVDAKPEVKAEVKADAKPEVKAEVKADAKPETKAEVKADAKPEIKAEVKADAKPEAKAEVKADKKIEPVKTDKNEVKSEQPASTPASKPVQKPADKSENKPEGKNDAKPAEKQEASKSEAKPEVKTEVKTEVRTEKKPDNKTAENRQNDSRNNDRKPQQDRKPEAVKAEAKSEAAKAEVKTERRNENKPEQKTLTQNEKFAQKYQNKPVQPQTQAKDQKKQEQKKPQKPQNQPVQPSGKSEVNTNVQSERSSHIKGTRVVDTRVSTVDLDKYDDRLENLVPDAQKNASGEKQKLKKQNTSDRRGGSYDKERDKERQLLEKQKRQELEKARKAQLVVSIPDEITVGDLAARLKQTAANVIKRLMMLGVMATVNQVVDFDTAALVADELGAKVNHEVTVTIEDKLFEESAEDNDETLIPRAPVVCVMGHVDHGKTSLLDAIRHTNVTKGEAGGITQHIGAYRVKINDQDITFLDTPGHEAFTAMRARGAKSTDIAILVVAADDGIMPQTIEAINHAKAAGVDIIVAINKMDKYGANPDNIKQDLTKYDLVPEEWGGDVICVPVSALTGMGIDDLLENVLLVAEMKELKANPNRRAKGLVIEAKLDKGKGPVATVLVQNGTLHSGDVVIAGTSVGRVRAMTNDKGQTLKEAGPSVPVEIVGLAEVPGVGDEFNAVDDERMARELADQRKEKIKEDEFKANAKVSLDDLFAQISEGAKELNIIVKADVGGSAEAVKQSLEKLSNEEVKVRVIHNAAGGITEGDVMFAAASNAIIVGFNVRPDKTALDSAERQKVDIRTYRIIYDCIEEIKAAMTGMLAPTFKEVLLGHIEVRQTIHVPNVGTIAGSYVQDGKVQRNAQIRVVRDGVVIFEDKISSLRRFKDDVKEVAQGYECGIGLERFNDIKIGDILEAFIMEEVAKTL